MARFHNSRSGFPTNLSVTITLVYGLQDDPCDREAYTHYVLKFYRKNRLRRVWIADTSRRNPVIRSQTIRIDTDKKLGGQLGMTIKSVSISFEVKIGIMTICAINQLCGKCDYFINSRIQNIS